AERYRDGVGFAIVVVAEGAMSVDGGLITRGQEVGREVRLGGIAEQVADAIAKRSGVETRSLVLGHLQRGGTPSAQDRTLALAYGSAAVRLIEEGRFGHMVAWQPPRMRPVPIAEAVATMKAVPLDGDLVAAARDLGVCLGDG
ncbi:MAG: 6-phosphofructokinase, partial [Planctomycetota bacterium]